ncbi:MAG: hypothetical protein NDI80_02795 [Flavobacteriaceae bacterium]|jgi:hypothetical protein|nr:hypothetical protein [Flavobacteriaceae bacterium]
MSNFILLYSVFFFSLNLSANSLDKVRNTFPYFDKESEVDYWLEQLNTDQSALANAYKGALYMFKSKFVSFPTNKYKYFKKGKNLIEAANVSNPNSLEIKYIRLVFQYQLPSFLGYNNQKEHDFQFFIKHFNTPNIRVEIKANMRNQLLKLEKLEPEKIQQLKLL